MVEGLPFSVGDMSLGGLLAFVVVTFIVALLKGLIVPRIHYDDVSKARDFWRDSSLNKDKTIQTLSSSVAENTVGNESIVKVMSVLSEKASENSGADQK